MWALVTWFSEMYKKSPWEGGLYNFFFYPAFIYRDGVHVPDDVIKHLDMLM